MSDVTRIMGAAINGVHAALLNRDTILAEFSRREELARVDDREFYPLSLYTALCDYLEERLGKYAFLRVGRKMAVAVMDTAFPPHLETVPQAVEEIDRAHQMFCQPVIGAFKMTEHGPGRLSVHNSTPYNCILQEGMFYEIAIRYGADNATVTHVECRRTGAGACRYDIRH